MSKRAILYTRVSTDEQAEHGYSLKYQYEKLAAYCSIHGIEPIAHYQDDHSAKTFIRPQFQKLLEYLQKNKNSVDLLLFIKWDRFSRNASESYEMLARLKKYNIEAQAIEQPLDISVPENKLMLALYLASPEVENDRRSLNTKAGLRRAIKEGRWCQKAPKGYDNRRNEFNKPVIMPNADAEYIRQAFLSIESGEQTQQEVRKKLMERGWSCSKSNFSVLLRNPVYMGCIRLKADKDEPETIVKGSHPAIISEKTFYAVQDIISGKKAKHGQGKSHGQAPELPLRGFLVCPRCGARLTGSASRGHGGKYFYYHCSQGCPERVRATAANNKFIELLKEFEPREEVQHLYNAILKDLLQECEAGKKDTLKTIEVEIAKIQTRIENLQDKFADNHVDIADYNSARQRYEAQLRGINEKKQQMTFVSKDVYDQLVFSFSFLKELPSFYQKASLDVKRRIIGSIFPESLTFSENQYRTSRVNEVVSLISRINKPFRRNKKGQFCEKSELSCQVAPTGIEPVFKV